MLKVLVTLLLAIVLNWPHTSVADTSNSDSVDRSRSSIAAYSTLSGNYLAGRFAFDQNDVSSAVKYYKGVLEEDTNNTAILQRALILALQKETFTESLRFAKRLVALDSDSNIGNLVLAVQAIQRNTFQQAQTYIAKIDRNGIYSLLLPLIEGWVKVGLDANFEDVVTTLAPISNDQSFKAYYNYHKALIAAMAERWEISDKSFEIAYNDKSGATLRIATVYGSYLINRGRLEEGRDVVKRFSERNPGSLWIDVVSDTILDDKSPTSKITTVRDGVAETLFGAASGLSNKNAHDTALIFANLALQLRPNFPIVIMLSGEKLDMLRRFDDSVKVYRSIPSTSPFYWSAKMRTATSLANIERIDEAEKILREMINERTSNADAAIALGDILRINNRFEESIEYYNLAIDQTEMIETWHWSLFYSRGIVLERTNRWQLAEEDFLKALTLQPDQPLVLNYLGYSWVEKGINLQRAMALIKRAVSLRPTDGYIVDSLGWAFYRLERYEEAVKHLERAVILRPEDPIITDHLGDIYWHVGRKVEARFQWKRSLILGADEETASMIRSKLEKGIPHRDESKR